MNNEHNKQNKPLWSGWLSKSQILLFEKCPRAWYLSKIKAVPPEEKLHLNNGRDVHSLFEWVYTVKDKFNDYEDLLNTLKINKMYSLHKQQAENFAKLIKEISLSKPLYTEYKIFNKKLGVVGILDRIDKINDEYFVVEYKWHFNEFAFKDHVFELSLYSWLYEQDKGVKVNKGAVLYVNDKILRLIDIDEQSKQEAVDRVYKTRGEMIRGMAKGEEGFEKRPGKWCKYCQFAKYCQGK